MNHISIDNLWWRQYFSKKGDFNKAIEIYESILDTPKNIRAQNGLKTSKIKNVSNSNPSQNIINSLVELYNQNETELLLEKTNTLLFEFPSSFILWNMRGILNLDTKRPNNAARCFEKAVSLNPSFADGFVNLGNIYQDQGKLDEAVLAYKKAINIEPNNANAFYNLGNLFVNQDKLNDAEINFKHSISIKENNPKAYNNLANIYQKQKNLN